MSTSLMKKPIYSKSSKVWSIPSQKSQFVVVGNQYDDLEYDKMAYIRIVPQKGHPIVFRAKIQKKMNGVSVNSFIKFIRIPQNQISFMPQDIKMIDVEIIKIEE